jgi:hypothetical protein
MTIPSSWPCDALDGEEPSEAALALLAQRAQAFRITHDHRDLWPGVDAGAIRTAADHIGNAVAAVLAGSRTQLSADANAAEAFSIAAHVTGVGPLLGHWCERNALEADEVTRAVLALHLRHARMRVERVSASVRSLVDALADHAISPGILKGFHTAHCYFPEPGTRSFADVDLVVDPTELARAIDVLRAQGYVEGDGYDAPYKRVWRPPGEDSRVRSFTFWHARSGWIIELHSGALFEHLRGHSVRLDALGELNATWDFHGTSLRVASQPQLVALLATHASGELYASRLLRLVELVLVIRKDRASDRLDWPAVTELLRSANALRFAYPAFTLAEQLVPGTIDAATLEATAKASTARTRAFVAGFTPTSPLLRGTVSVAQLLMWTTNPWQVLTRLWAMIAPVGAESSESPLTVYRSRARRFCVAILRRSVPGRAP